MRILFFSNRFPVDDPAEIFRRLRQQSQRSQHVVLRQLLHEVTTAVRDEIRLLPAELRSRLPPFTSILDLAEHYNWHRGPLCGTFECVFLCLVSLCLFVGDFETRPEQFPLSKSDTVVTGLGLGFLAATAVVAAPSLTDLPQVAADVVRIAMRVGLVVYGMSQDLEPQDLDASPQSWTTLIKGLGEEVVQRELDRFHESTGTPGPSQLYISVVEPDASVFINGPPSRMRLLFSTPGVLQTTPRAPLPVYGGPCHAAHLYDYSHVAWTVQHVRPNIGQISCLDSAPLLSMANGQPLHSATALELFESATLILLTNIIRWGEVVVALTHISSSLIDKEAHQQEEACVRIESCKPSLVIDDLMRTLQAGRPGCTTVSYDVADWIAHDNYDALNDESENKIAVVGMSCRLPGGADDLERFWELLEDGRDVHQHIPADRYDVETHTDPTGRRVNTSQTPFGCFINEPGLFDAGFFDMSPREAGQTDPTHRLALLTAYEALEQSGYVPDRTPSSTRQTVGTMYGQCSDDYREANAGQDIDMYFIPGNYRAFAPGRISYFFKFSGPSFSCDTACSASLAAVQIACAALSRGEANMVVAGGLNILTSSDSFAGLSRAFFLSKTGGCKVFDDSADGYCRGDGIGSVILKRLSDAQRDNDNVLGVILATATNHSSAAVSITHPHAPTQADLFKNVLTQAGVSPLDVDLIEMHGTGTQAGDAAEIDSVTRVFCPGRRRPETLHIGSVKANLGHGEASAGIAALMKALLIFQHNAIPKHVGIKTRLNSKFPDLDRLNVHIPHDTVSWPHRADRPRYIMVNNFSAAGGNTSLLLAEPPQRPEPDPNSCPATTFVVGVSAKNALSLRRNLETLIAHLYGRLNSVHLPSLSYTTMARRIHYARRIAIQGSSSSEILEKLQLRLADLTGSLQDRPVQVPAAPPVAFVFSGQGSFYTGIGRTLLEHYPPYEQDIHGLDQLCLLHGLPSILPALRGSDQPTGHGTSGLIPVVSQLATVCVQIALFRLWTHLGVRPHAVIGASLGEYAALHAAGVLSASETIYLVGRRALLMEELCAGGTHSMLAVQATVEDIQQCVSDRSLYEVACINSPRSVTISGLIANITTVKSTLESHGYRTVLLNVPYAFHSAHMNPILERFGEVTRQIHLRPPKVPILSPLLSSTILEGQILPVLYLRDATRHTVHFSAALEHACHQGIITPKTAFVEIGIHQTYSKAVRDTVSGVGTIVPTMRSDEDNWKTLAASMCALHEAGVALDWNEFYQPFEQHLRLLQLPSYHWNLKNHWLQYNGDWLLTKDKEPSGMNARESGAPAPSGLRTPLLHRIVEETLSRDGGRVVIESNVCDEEFFGVASGHKMAGRPVVSVFSYPDMALSLAKYIHSKIRPNIATPAMDFGNVHVLQGLIPMKNRSLPQYVRLRIDADLKRSSSAMQVSIYQETQDGAPEEFATGTVSFGDPTGWLSDWANIAHLVTSRIAALHDLVHQGQADRFTQAMVYRLFQSIVDYSVPYRGIQSVVVHGLEAVADIILPPSPEGRWPMAPPHQIDALAHVGGFILNAGPATDSSETMYVMEGWKSMRFGKVLAAGTTYRSYVRMMPSSDGSGFFFGDVYIMEGEEIIGVVGGMTLRPLPRILMKRFFDPSDPVKADSAAKPSTALSETKMSTQSPISEPIALTPSTHTSTSESPPFPATPLGDSESGRTSELTPGSAAAKVLALIASETGVDIQDLTDETHVAEIGVDSLLSLVLAEKFAQQLDVHLPGSFFLESPTIKMVKARFEA
ncbi:hypothetical protein BJY04DRAFT_231310 [Aspergillus karnatakaensis]|uniref:type I polyketide synthase n=1 Tax=Aspergillus karnatakaensis TaxID=1810916 RepID=UPI003CCCB0F8